LWEFADKKIAIPDLHNWKNYCKPLTCLFGFFAYKTRMAIDSPVSPAGPSPFQTGGRWVGPDSSFSTASFSSKPGSCRPIAGVVRFQHGRFFGGKGPTCQGHSHPGMVAYGFSGSATGRMANAYPSGRVGLTLTSSREIHSASDNVRFGWEGIIFDYVDGIPPLR